MKVLHRADFTGEEVYCPIHVARFLNNGTWHGAGLFHLLFSLHREYEEMLKRLFENVRHADDFEIPILPITNVNQRTTLQTVDDKFRILGYHKDPFEADARPFKISPKPQSDVPGRTASFAGQLLSGLSPVDDIIKEKGRIDSAEAMEILQEEATRKLTTSLRQVSRLFGSYHRSTLADALRMMTIEPRRLNLTRLSQDLAGVVFAEDGSMSFGQDNSLPHISHLTFNVRETAPVNRSNQKRAALEMFRLSGGLDLTGLKIHAIREGFDLDMDMEADKNAYEAIVWDILRLYNDGETPQDVVVTPFNASRNSSSGFSDRS